MSGFLNFLQQLIHPAKKADQNLLALNNRIQSLELAVSDYEKSIQNLKNEIIRNRENQLRYEDELVAGNLEKLVCELSNGILFLNRQRYLMTNQNQSVAPKDIQTVIDQMTRTLANHGMSLIGQCGDSVLFDPELHAHLTTQTQISQNRMVRIVFNGYTYHGRTIKKALVEEIN